MCNTKPRSFYKVLFVLFCTFKTPTAVYQVPEETVSTCFTQSSTRVFGSIGSAPVCFTFFIDKPGQGGWNSAKMNIKKYVLYYNTEQQILQWRFRRTTCIVLHLSINLTSATCHKKSLIMQPYLLVKSRLCNPASI